MVSFAYYGLNYLFAILVSAVLKFSCTEALKRAVRKKLEFLSQKFEIELEEQDT